VGKRGRADGWRLTRGIERHRICMGYMFSRIISIFRGIGFSRFEFGFVVRTLVRFHGAKAPTTNRIQVIAPFH